jgi:hypothetical protein
LRYHTQVLPVPDEELCRVNRATTWSLWSGSICRVPLSTVWLSTRQGGLGVSQVHHLFLNRCMRLLQREATRTAEWIELWNRTVAPGNPPNIHVCSIPVGLIYLRLLFREICHFPSDIYFPPPEGPSAPNYIHICHVLCKFCRWF